MDRGCAEWDSHSEACCRKGDSPGGEEHEQRWEAKQVAVNSGKVECARRGLGTMLQFFLAGATNSWRETRIFWGDGLMNPGFQQGSSEGLMRQGRWAGVKLGGQSRRNVAGVPGERTRLLG